MNNNKVLKFYLWRPFPKIEGAFIAEQVRDRGGSIWDSGFQADVIFVHVRQGPAVVREARQNNGRAVLIALIRRGAGGLKQRCLEAGANMAFSMPAGPLGFKAMFTHIYAQLQS